MLNEISYITVFNPLISPLATYICYKYRYLFLTAQWKIGVNMPTKRGDFAIGVVGNKVICAGGLGKYSTILIFIKVASHPQLVFQVLKMLDVSK